MHPPNAMIDVVWSFDRVLLVISVLIGNQYCQKLCTLGANTLGMPNDYKSLEDAIKSFLEIHGLDEQAAIQRVISRWPELMGAPIEQQTEKLWFRAGIFYVKMNSPVWKHELHIGREKIRQLLNDQMGKEIIREVRII